MDNDLEEFLIHYGVKGMKWGVRKDRKNQNARNSNYTEQQRKRDKQIYGRRGSKRINRSMNRGNTISVARGDEKTRRDRVMSKNKYWRQGGKTVGAVAGGAVGLIASRAVQNAVRTRRGQTVILRALGPYLGSFTIGALISPAANVAMTAGAAKVAHMMSGDITVSARMRAHGYNPNRR